MVKNLAKNKKHIGEIRLSRLKYINIKTLVETRWGRSLARPRTAGSRLFWSIDPFGMIDAQVYDIMSGRNLQASEVNGVLPFTEEFKSERPHPHLIDSYE